jgi:hypothetical protein
MPFDHDRRTPALAYWILAALLAAFYSRGEFAEIGLNIALLLAAAATAWLAATRLLRRRSPAAH